jgi:hypothetical protein
MNEARARGLTEKHPDVIKYQHEIAQLEVNIKNSNQGDQPLSIAQENARAEQQRAGLRAKSARAELDRLQEQQTDLEARLAETPKVAEQLSAYEREYQHLFDSYQQYSTKRLEAGVAADMERRQKGEKFRVLEAAVPTPEPASPNRPVILVIGSVLALLAGAGLALLAEITDLSFHDPRSLQSRLGIPVLAAVPPVVLESDRVFGRARRVRQLIGAVTVTSFVLAASLAGNWIVNGPPGPLARLIAAGPPSAAAPAPDSTSPAGGGR